MNLLLGIRTERFIQFKILLEISFVMYANRKSVFCFNGMLVVEIAAKTKTNTNEANVQVSFSPLISSEPNKPKIIYLHFLYWQLTKDVCKRAEKDPNGQEGTEAVKVFNTFMIYFYRWIKGLQIYLLR